MNNNIFINININDNFYLNCLAISELFVFQFFLIGSLILSEIILMQIILKIPSNLIHLLFFKSLKL